ncbi:uncharacterized protein LOC105789618 [Gossypium raimondii]|uniref:uncharacterized protein LOC105789618 n=1 Tax=Gossypium raimondii TaxID=29730 RepID=UPI00227A8A80|nr:uncharacterized protein LOC105789618 [Gossypium raimondii]
MVKIGTCMTEEAKQDFIELLREFKDVFAWSYQDMPGLSTDIVVHLLPIKEDCKPFQQKLRRMRLDVVLKIKEEVQNQFDAGFLHAVKYSEWHPEDMKKTAFITLWGTFCYKVMPFGVKNAGATYQRVMVTLFHDIMHKEIEVYVDDMIAKSRTEREHVRVLRKLFLRLRKFQLKLNPAKCIFEARSGKLLRFVVSEKGIEIDPDKVKAIRDLPPPRTQKEVRGQHDETGKKEKAIYYLSKKFTDCEMRYSPIEKLCCALIWTTRRLRWQILLSEFDIVYVNQKAIKRSAIAEFLANRALEDYEPLNFDFPNEDLMYVAIAEEDSHENHPWKLNFDGASNAIGNGIGAVLVSSSGDHYPFTSKLVFDCTNNMAKYEACITGIRAAIERKIKILEVYGDSALVIYQLKGEWKTRDPKLIRYQKLVLELIVGFNNFTFCYLPRDENQIDNALATLACMIKVNKSEDMKPIQISIYETPAPCYSIDEEENNDYPWHQDILRYLKNREYPNHATENDKRTLRRLAIDYVLDGEILYKKGKDQVLLKCVDAGEAKKILEEVHEGICGTLIAEVCNQFKIRHHNSSHEKLSFALLAYRTSIRTSTRATSFSLVYGMEAVLPIEVEIPSLRVLAELKLDEPEWIQSRYDQLNLIEEKRLKAIRHGEDASSRARIAYVLAGALTSGLAAESLGVPLFLLQLPDSSMVCL